MRRDVDVAYYFSHFSRRYGHPIQSTLFAIERAECIHELLLLLLIRHQML